MSATGGVNMLPMVGNCVSLSWQILQLLLVSKGNKNEHKSLQSALTNIHRFLQAIPFDGVTAEGNEVLSKWAWCWGCGHLTAATVQGAFSAPQIICYTKHAACFQHMKHITCSTSPPSPNPTHTRQPRSGPDTTASAPSQWGLP